MKIEDAWYLQRQWSAVATRVGATLARWRAISLGLILAGSVLGALAAQSNWFSATATVWLGAVGGVALAFAALVQGRLLTAEKARGRVGTRAGSEALKGIVYQYLAQVAPFDGPDRDRQLSLKVTEMERLAADFAPMVIGARAAGGALPQIDGVRDYVALRAEEQRNWHQHRAAERRNLAGRWRIAELSATAAAATLAALGGVLHGPNVSAWVAVATTAGAAIGSHLASEQHDRIADAYARTVLALDAVLRDFDPTTATEDAAGSLVVLVESILAEQNNSWVSLFSTKSGE
jgi:hypothetical protein